MSALKLFAAKVLPLVGSLIFHVIHSEGGVASRIEPGDDTAGPRNTAPIVNSSPLQGIRNRACRSLSVRPRNVAQISCS
jgi:hypothetical protein